MANSAFTHDPQITVPGSSTDNAVVIFDGTAGTAFGNSTIIVDSGGNGRIGIAADTNVITLTSGTVTIAGTVAATTLTGAGAGITALNGTQVTSGTIPVAQLGSSGTRSSSTFLNGVNAWAAVGGGGTDFSCRAKSTASQSLAANFHVLIVLNNEDFDTDDMHDNSTNNSRITFDSGNAGTYVVLGQLGFAGNATGQRIVRLLVNGTAVARIARSVVGSSTVECLMIGMIWTFSAGNYVEMSGFQSSSGSLSVAVASQEGPYLMVAKILG